MIFRNLQLLIAATILLGLVAQAQEHNSREHKSKGLSVLLGTVEITIPAPEGFEEVTAQFEHLNTLFKATEPPENDLLAGYLSASDCELVRRGEKPLMSFYAKTSVLRAGREQVVDEKFFAQIVDNFRKNDETLLDPNSARIKAVLENVDQVISKQTAKDIKTELGEPKNLGAFDLRPNVYSVMLFWPSNVEVGGARVTIPLAVTLSFVRIKQKVIFTFTYRKYNSKADVETLQAFTTKWINSILAAN